MHRLFKFRFLVPLMAVALSSCANLQNTSSGQDDPTEGEPNAGSVRFIGEVTNIEQGLDGSLVELTDRRARKVLHVVISLPNLGADSEFDFADIKAGSLLKVSGEVADLEGKAHMVARTAYGYQPVDVADKSSTPEEQRRCEAVGGQIRATGLLGADNCIQNLPDAGEACTRHEVCLGRCVIAPEQEAPEPGSAVDGVCEADDNIFGCTALVHEGRYEGTLCID